MTSPMPAFAVYHHRTFLGFVPAVSYQQAVKRAKALYPGKRLEVELSDSARPARLDTFKANRTYNAKRAIPSPCKGFDERRADAIAAWKAENA